jgi:uncharacterized membrane protein YkvA (DUF1232 family)
MALRRLLGLRHVVRVINDARRPGAPDLQERVLAVPRMVRAVLNGEYDGTSPARLAAIAAGIAYVASPVDVVPEAVLLVLGVVDDIGVAAWVAGALLVETDKFLAWEREQGRVVVGEAVV